MLANDSQIVTRRAGAAVLLARVCQELRIRSIINSMVDWDPKQCKLSPGTRIVALILNALTSPRPLYKIKEFYRRRCLELMFEEKVDVDALGDSAFGRALDKLAAIESLPMLVQTVALSAVNQGKMEVRSVHADTTSISVYGDFEPTATDKEFCQAQGKDLIDITFGHSKQKRPDLKQYTCGLITSKDGIPLYGDINDGNLNDQIWNSKVLEAIKTSFLDPRRIIYVADSSLVTKKNLELITDQQIRFISRLPARFKTLSEVKRKAFRDKKWVSIGRFAQTTKHSSEYWAQSYQSTIYGHQYRLIVYRSSSMNERTQKNLEKTIAKERAELVDLVKKMENLQFACFEDAQRQLDRVIEEHASSLHRLTGEVIKINKVQRPPGRPRNNVEYPVITHYELRMRLLEPTEAAKTEWCEQDNAFVLITNLPEDIWNAREILTEYKSQTKVEQGFRLIKHPIVADGIFLKSTRRVEAFAYVTIIALIVASYLQYKVRSNLQKQGPNAQLYFEQGSRSTDRPTSVALLDELNYILVNIQFTPDAGYKYYLAEELPEYHIKMLELAGYGQYIYETPLCS